MDVRVGIIKKVKHWRIDAYELWCWRRLLRVPHTARRSNQSILREISPEYSLEELMVTLKLQYFGHLMWRTDSLEKTLMPGKDRRQEEKGLTKNGWMASATQWKWVWVNSGWWTRRPGMLQFTGLQSRSQLSDWTDCHEVMWWDALIFVFWMLSFKLVFSLSSFTFFKRFFNSLCFLL